METKDLEHEIKKDYDNSSLIALTANLFKIYKNKNQIEKISNFYIRGCLSLILNLIIIFSIYTIL